MFATIDPILYARVVHVGEGEVDPEELSNFARATDAARAVGAWRAAMGSERAALFREAYRYWLGLRLPFLYRQATLTLAREEAEFRKLASEATPVGEWHVPLPPVDPLECRVEPHRLSPKMLVETAVELASRRVDGRRNGQAAGGGSDAAEVLAAATALIGDPVLALRSLVPIVIGSLHTANPMMTFEACCARVRASPDECQAADAGQWWTLLRLWLDQMLPGADDTHAPRRMHMADALRSRNEHLLITAPAREWEARAEEDAAYRWFLLEPNTAPLGVAESIWRDFQPSVTIYSFHLAGAARRTMTVIDGDALASCSPDAVHQMLTMHGIMRRVAGFEPTEPRLCGHVSCAHHQAGFCAWYPHVPREPERCTFPVRLARMRVEARGDASSIRDGIRSPYRPPSSRSMR